MVSKPRKALVSFTKLSTTLPARFPERWRGRHVACPRSSTFSKSSNSSGRKGVAGTLGAEGGWVSRLVGVVEVKPRGRRGPGCRARPPRPLSGFISIRSATPQQPLSRRRRRGSAGAGAPGSLPPFPSPPLRPPPPPARGPRLCLAPRRARSQQGG